jgi:hypothetical protein
MMSIAATRIYRSNKLLKIYRYVGDDLFFFPHYAHCDQCHRSASLTDKLHPIDFTTSPTNRVPV